MIRHRIFLTSLRFGVSSLHPSFSSNPTQSPTTVRACMRVCVHVLRTGGGGTMGSKGAGWMGPLSLLSQTEKHLPSHFKTHSFTLYNQAFILRNYSLTHMYTHMCAHTCIETEGNWEPKLVRAGSKLSVTNNIVRRHMHGSTLLETRQDGFMAER